MPWYNEDRKRKFLKSSDFSSAQKKAYKFLFKACYPTEQAFDSDVSEFSTTEFESLLSSFLSTSLESLKMRTSLIRSYIDFCINNGYAETKEGDPLHINVADAYVAEVLEKFVRPDAEEKRFLVGRDLDKFIEFCNNPQDAVIIQLLREGIRGRKLEELSNLRRQDVNFSDNIVTLRHEDGNKRVLSVSPKTIELIQDAINQKKYYFKNGEATGYLKEINLEESDYILRPAHRHDADKFLNQIGISRRIKAMAKLYGNSFITAHTLFVSGQIEYGRMLKERDGIDELYKKHYLEICERFGLAPTQANAVKYAIQKHL